MSRPPNPTHHSHGPPRPRACLRSAPCHCDARPMISSPPPCPPVDEDAHTAATTRSQERILLVGPKPRNPEGYETILVCRSFQFIVRRGVPAGGPCFAPSLECRPSLPSAHQPTPWPQRQADFMLSCAARCGWPEGGLHRKVWFVESSLPSATRMRARAARREPLTKSSVAL